MEHIYAAIRSEIMEITGANFTPIQASAIQNISTNRFFSFSAPTSAGKSFIFKYLLQKEKKDTVIILPSRALISEYITEIRQIVGSDVLVLEFADDINKKRTKRRIYVLTPERAFLLFRISTKLDVRLVLLDEAQLSEENSRGLLFDAFVRKIQTTFPKSKLIFAHPFIGNPEAQFEKHGILESTYSTNYKQNTVGKVYVVKKRTGYEFFNPLNTKEPAFHKFDSNFFEWCLREKKTILIFCSKAHIYKNEFGDDISLILNGCEKIANYEALAIIQKLRDYIGSAQTANSERFSHLIEMLEKGIVIHHGSIPLRCRFLIEEFIRKGFCKVCLATSTLIQGINMPFDVVYIDNFNFRGTESTKSLDLKNLIGRAGRSNNQSDAFDYGFVVVNSKNSRLFCERMIEMPTLSQTSKLDGAIEKIDIDDIDFVEAAKNDDFSSQFQITQSQVNRIVESEIDDDINFILDSFVDQNGHIENNKYYSLPKSARDRVKLAFRSIYISHRRRKELTKSELGVLSTAIPIMLWRAEGRSFKEIVALRMHFITKQSEISDIKRKQKRGEITAGEAEELISKTTFKFSPIAANLPNRNGSSQPLFSTTSSIKTFNYDRLVYDTYDYLDKVISLSLIDPICAALDLFYQDHNDARASSLSKYIRYGTNDDKKIMLLRYGFEHDDLEWLDEIVEKIDENEIILNSMFLIADPDQKEKLRRYL